MSTLPEVDCTQTLFGVAVADPFRRLEDAADPEVTAWADAQDLHTRSTLAALPARAQLEQRLAQLLYVDAISAPRRYGSRYFYSRRHAHKEKAILYFREGESGEEQVLLDPNQPLALPQLRGVVGDGGQQADPATLHNVSIGVWQPSPDGNYCVYAVRANNSDEATLYVLEVHSRQHLPTDVLPGGKYAHPSWTPESDAFYYTFLPAVRADDPAAAAQSSASAADDLPRTAAERPGFAEVRLHQLGTEQSADLRVFPAQRSPRSFVSAELSRDGQFLFVYIHHGWNASDVYLRALPGGSAQARALWATANSSPAELRAAFVPLCVGLAAHFHITAHAGTFYIFTDEDAPRSKVLSCPATAYDRAHWQELIPEHPEAVLTDLTIVGGHLGLHRLRRAHSELWLHALDGTQGRPLPLPGLGQSYGLLGHPDDDTVFFHYTSFTQPAQIFAASVTTGQAKLWAEVELPGLAEVTAQLQTTQVDYWSPGAGGGGEAGSEPTGARITMFLVHRRDLPRDGSTPFLLSGYGGFNVSMLPEFSSGMLTFLEAGGGLAIPNLRGGGEYGEAWHQAGMRAHKQNVFADFLAAAEFLFQSGYTSPERLAIRGGSNGGLLVGAALTQRPEVCAAVVCAVPLLDMLRYHLFGSGQTWTPEYGDPDLEEEFRWLAAYSPYHHVERRAYPAVLFLSADHDDRVDPMHARKMAALLQSRQTGPAPILLRIERGAGHGGADRIRSTVEQAADTYAFLFEQLGMRWGG